jgi:hypothetical protein
MMGTVPASGYNGENRPAYVEIIIIELECRATLRRVFF